MMQIIQSETFNKWAQGLRDPQARALVASRLLRLSQGMANDIAEHLAHQWRHHHD